MDRSVCFTLYHHISVQNWYIVLCIFSCFQDLVSLSHFGGLLFYPYSSFSAQYLIPSVRPRVDFRVCPSTPSGDYVTSSMLTSSFPPLGVGGLKYLTPGLPLLPKPSQKNQSDCGQDESLTGWKYWLLCVCIHVCLHVLSQSHLQTGQAAVLWAWQ